jgi:hypothetical protein
MDGEFRRGKQADDLPPLPGYFKPKLTGYFGEAYLAVAVVEVSTAIATTLVVVITTALVASYTIADFFLFTVALVFTDIAFILATIPFILTFVRPATFLASILTIIIICKLQVLMGV